MTPELIRYLTSVDYISLFALVAIDPVSQHGVAIARYELTGDDATAEVAIAVTSAWRHAGLATVLLRLLAQAAAEQGIATLGGTYFADNRPVAALVNVADGSAQRVTGHGIAEFKVVLGFYPDAFDRGNQP